MIARLWLLAALCAPTPALAQTPPDMARLARAVRASGAVLVEIETALKDSAAGWAAGDLDRFMAVYADAPDTSYVTAKGLITGKAAIAAHYAPFFSGDHKADRGALTFATLHFEAIDKTHAFYIGLYHVAATPAHPKEWTGPTSLLFVKTPQGWKIAADHSS